ncbi:4-(cytidine 5'-diphospho)-2-C-methyl-D-erythritol kinase [Rhodobacter sp. KR11]|uniref:4-(cytidine 5'-diphospho)-2-C-methyl-D-erythritol kinase n=1 Tax=Rhodobacter sp. KR11 TaxID=2974588 RepID=UPI002223E6B0|nr:4-(cytidine 5'-diphospho)-2-C-methyl-D-erythritol kinase [Rhodobacter sp. KR11]MCW1920038.1 4-(cytidine 5'-diphospho)-2-C-methyl-D-erythritol kinase [Rhodobacter sp. KR11]
MAAEIERRARAKVNLALHVTGRRGDGYHLLDSLVGFADFGDVVRVRASDVMSLTVTGPMAAGLGAGEDNLVLRAARLMGRPAAITLDKHLPLASGIGGGSADAAATLRALADLHGVDLPDPAAVLGLGADVPVCLLGRPARMAGIGEDLTPLRLPPAHLVLVNPGVTVSTPEVFRALTRRDNPPLPVMGDVPDAAALADWLAGTRNDLQEPALRLRPQIGAVLAALNAVPGCLVARMSGSGATCFGLFAEAALAEAAALSLARPGWWVQFGALV